MTDETKELEKAIEDIPRDGEWWKQSTHDTFLTGARRLRELGMPFEEIEDFLDDLYRAVADEYGE